MWCGVLQMQRPRTGRSIGSTSSLPIKTSSKAGSASHGEHSGGAHAYHRRCFKYTMIRRFLCTSSYALEQAGRFRAEDSNAIHHSWWSLKTLREWLTRKFEAMSKDSCWGEILNWVVIRLFCDPSHIEEYAIVVTIQTGLLQPRSGIDSCQLAFVYSSIKNVIEEATSRLKFRFRQAKKTFKKTGNGGPSSVSLILLRNSDGTV